MTIRRIIASLFLGFSLGMSGASAATNTPAAPDAIAPLLEDAKAATKSAAASDEKAKSLGAQQATLSADYKAKKATNSANLDALYAPVQQSCPNGYPAERAALCHQIYQTYVSNFDAMKQRFHTEVFEPYSQRWDALDAQKKAEKANAEKQRAAAQRALAILLKSFPNCTIGYTDAELELAVNCFSLAWDGARHQVVTVDGSGNIHWNDQNPNAKKYHDQFNAYDKAQKADQVLLQTLESQAPGRERDMRMVAVKQRMDGRSQKMDFLIYEARTAPK